MKDYDGTITVTDNIHRQPATVHVRIYKRPGALPLAIATETPENTGPSVTNAAEAIATLIWHGMEPTAEGITYIEHYATRPEEYDLVEFQVNAEGTLYDPTWKRITRADVEALTGEPVTD